MRCPYKLTMHVLIFPLMNMKIMVRVYAYSGPTALIRQVLIFQHHGADIYRGVTFHCLKHSLVEIPNAGFIQTLMVRLETRPL